MGEGAKTSAALNSGTWAITNSDSRVLACAISWAKRQGVSRFRLKIQIPARDPKPDEEIKQHWAVLLALNIDDIAVYRKRAPQKTIPEKFGYGTGHLFARTGNTRLWHIWRGQMSQLGINF